MERTESQASRKTMSDDPAGVAPAWSAVERPPIELIGVRTHNLQNLHVRIPLGALTVVTGVSGSGKSSLVVDTLFAEGQRRYVESMSTYARQFLQRLQKPDVDEVRGILPAIAIRQHAYARNPRSTVGTVTEVYDYLRVLFARLARYVCPDCGRSVTVHTPQSVWQWLLRWADSPGVVVLAPVDVDRDQPVLQLRQLRREGFIDVWWQGERVDLDSMTPAQWTAQAVQWLWLGRRRPQPERRDEWIDLLDLAFGKGRGRMGIVTPDGQLHVFSQRLECASCGRTFPPLEPSLFSFNRPEGACPACQGFGDVADLDWTKIIPDPGRPLKAHPIQPWNTPGLRFLYRFLFRAAERYGWDLDTPWKDLPETVRQAIMEGTDRFFGIRGFFEKLQEKRYKRGVRIFIARYRTYRPCTACGGTRLRPEARWARIGEWALTDVVRWPVADVLAWLRRLEMTPAERQALSRVYEELERRLNYLVQVGLGYLTLDRQAGTLSGGEAQRIQMAIALGTALSDTLLILDEPSAGLHPRDTQRLIEILRHLRDQGNTVIAVEHDPDIILAADHVLELGPGAGHQGGRLVYEGPPSGLLDSNVSTATARFLRRYRLRPTRTRPHRTPRGWIVVEDAHAHNLAHIRVRIPTRCLTVITGVSGSGKSSLLQEVLYPALRRYLGKPLPRDVQTWGAISVSDSFQHVVLVDPNPPSRNPRASVLSYMGGWTELRQWWARLPEARARGLTSGDFSWNSPRGRCPTCRGFGRRKVELLFLSDLWLPCETCHGARLRPEALEVRWNGFHLADVLEWTAVETWEAFRDVPGLRRLVHSCMALNRIGLGYLRLGQDLATLSGGEAQRLKLARMLARPTDRRNAEAPTVFLLDEPTIGLHGEDLPPLLDTIEHLLELGHTVVVVEHHPEVILNADYVIDLGPEGGREGGRVVAEGPLPELLTRDPGESHTLRFLQSWLCPATSVK
jgi:excinuclease ABC subunit A